MKKIKVNGISAKIHEDFGRIEFSEGERDLLNRKVNFLRIYDVGYKSKIYDEFDKCFKQDDKVTIEFSINCITCICEMRMIQFNLTSAGAEFYMGCCEDDVQIIEKL